MSADSSTSQTATTLRDSACTTPHPDVFAMVPSEARHILDVGCSNGAPGRSLTTAQPGRSVCGIKFDTACTRESADHLDHVINADLNLLDWREALVGRNFDCMIFADVLEHLVEPKRCLMQTRQHLRAGLWPWR